MTKTEYEAVKRKLQATYETNMDALNRIWELCGEKNGDGARASRSEAMKASWARRRGKKKT